MKKLTQAVLAAVLAVSVTPAFAKNVTYTFSVDTSGLATTNAILQIGMYAQHGNGTTAAGIWDNIVLAGPQTFSDNFDDRSLTDERIGNGWTWFDTSWTTADCSGASAGGFGPYSDGGGGFANYVHVNNNYTRHGDAGGNYFRAGLETVGSGKGLNVYGNQYAKSACNEIKIFKEFNVPKAQLDGNYTFKATVLENANTPIQEGNQVGVFFKVLSVDEGYTESQYERQTAFPEQTSSGGGGQTVVGGPDSVPTLPFGGLVLLATLLGWLGLRKSR